MAICTNCNATVEDNSRFCTECGHRILPVASPSPIDQILDNPATTTETMPQLVFDEPAPVAEPLFAEEERVPKPELEKPELEKPELEIEPEARIETPSPELELEIKPETTPEPEAEPVHLSYSQAAPEPPAQPQSLGPSATETVTPPVPPPSPAYQPAYQQAPTPLPELPAQPVAPADTKPADTKPPKTSRWAPMSVIGYVAWLLVYLIPIVGVIASGITMFASKKKAATRRFASAYFIVSFIFTAGIVFLYFSGMANELTGGLVEDIVNVFRNYEFGL